MRSWRSPPAFSRRWGTRSTTPRTPRSCGAPRTPSSRTAATLGATLLTELCRELEQLAGDGRFEGAESLVGRIRSETVRVERALAGAHPGGQA